MKEKIVSELVKVTKLKEEEIVSLLEIPPNSSLGDYAFPCFSLSKVQKKSPQEISSLLADKLSSNKFIEKVESKGPYLNIFLAKKALAKDVLTRVLKEKDKFGSDKVKEKVVIEFPSPNTNKPLHLGHVRNIVLGQSVSEIMKFSGNNVKIVNLNNDRGVHICKSMIAYETFSKTKTPKSENVKPDKFVGENYVKFSKESKKNPDLEEKAKECLRKWESGDKNTLSLWKKMNSWAFEGFKETYDKFDLVFDKEYFESKIYKEGKEIISDALKRKIVSKKADGAIFIDLSNKGLGEKILLRSDGTSIYITQDIFLANLKHKDFKFNKAIIVSAREQDYHFKVLFEILNKIGYNWASGLHHLSYGMVNLESGRMKSREGNVVDADDIIEELESLAEEGLKSRDEKISKSEIESRKRSIAMAALRYYFIKIDKIKDMVFNPEEAVKFEGDTGPYLLYTYARARSILRKAEYKGLSLPAEEVNEKEKQLLLKISQFPEVVGKAYNSLAPNAVANYSFSLAQAFNEFYHSSPVIGSKEEKFRLSLVDAFSQILKNSLSLLGIKTIEKM